MEGETSSVQQADRSTLSPASAEPGSKMKSEEEWRAVLSVCSPRTSQSLLSLIHTPLNRPPSVERAIPHPPRGRH